MATSEIRVKPVAEAAFTVTLAALANSTAGVGRQSTLLTNSNNYPAALVSVKLTSHATSAPTAGALAYVYLLRDVGTIADDAAGASDAALTVENAPLLGTIVFTANANKAFYGIFDTGPLGPLGPTWGIAIVNSSGQALHVTEGNHGAFYAYYVPEAQ
jgi:hypothetical protein